MRPRKYFCATMLVAVCDQNLGNSTFFCSKAGPSLPGTAVVAAGAQDSVGVACDIESDRHDMRALVDDAVGLAWPNRDAGFEMVAVDVAADLVADPQRAAREASRNARESSPIAPRQ